jgi:hypothetical protein
MQMLNRQSESLRAGANSHLLGAMRRIEERARERLSQPPNEQNSQPTRTVPKGGSIKNYAHPALHRQEETETGGA